MVKDSILVVYLGDGGMKAVDKALRAAKSGAMKVRVLMILDSELYHYGHVDLVAPRLNKQRFLLYIRDQVLEEGRKAAEDLREKALSMSVPIEIDSVETDDLVLTIVTEAQKGYKAIYLEKQKKKIFPLLKKNLASEIRKIPDARVIEC
jgi:hypothetical protein